LDGLFADMTIRKQTRSPGGTMDETESLKVQLAAARRESEDLRLRLQNLLLLYRHEVEFKVGIVHHAYHKPLAKGSSVALISKAQAV